MNIELSLILTALLLFWDGKGQGYQHVEPLVRDQALQVPDMEDRSYRPYFSVLLEHGFKHEVKKSRGFPKEQPQQSLPAFFVTNKNLGVQK